MDALIARLADTASGYDDESVRARERGDKAEADYYRGKRDGVGDARRQVLRALNEERRKKGGFAVMTRKDFELIAGVLASLDPDVLTNEQHQWIAEAFADRLAETNPNFDRERFMAAASAETEAVK